MDGAEHCLICGETIPEGMQVCKDCASKFEVELGKTTEAAEAMRDISGVLAITSTDRNLKKSVESILRIANRLGREKNGKKALQRKRVACNTAERTPGAATTDSVEAYKGKNQSNQRDSRGYGVR